jgi:acetate kinase
MARSSIITLYRSAIYREGVRRYGFHGLSYEYLAGRLGEIAPDIAGDT